MAQSNHLPRAAAFGTSFLLVTWVGGSLGAAGFKAVYWLSCGVWPDTALYGLVPEAALGPLRTGAGNGGPDAWVLGLLRLDILSLILLAPPLLLLPFLIGRLLKRHPKPFLLRLRHPFAPPSRDRGSNPTRTGNPSMKNGQTSSSVFGRRPNLPPPSVTTEKNA
ncbi:MAG: hypothetical protein AB7U59_07580 [Desulfovibrionaceae bacterium]